MKNSNEFVPDWKPSFDIMNSVSLEKDWIPWENGNIFIIRHGRISAKLRVVATLGLLKTSIDISGHGQIENSFFSWRVR